MPRPRLPLCVILAVLVASGASGAQQPGARFVVVGTVQDQTGGVLAGAQVTIAGPAGAAEQTVQTDGSGAFRFGSVPGGSYALRASYAGFKPLTLTLRVGPRPPSRQKIVLLMANLTQEITVDDRAALTADARQNRNAITIDQKMLGEIPVFDRDVIGAAARFLDPGSAATGGATLVVDGMEARKLGVSASAIQQIRINQDPYSAEFARPGSGRIEVITKSGQEEYHGEFNVTFRDARLNARNAFALTRPPEQRRIFEGALSGPIRGKTTSFLLSVNREETDSQAIVFAATPSGTFQANVPTPQRNIELSGTVTQAIGRKQTISIRATYQYEAATNEGVGGTSLPEAASSSSDREEEIIFSHQVVFGKKLVNQFRLLLGHDRQPTVSLTQAPGIDVNDAFSGGGAQSDQVESETHVTLNDTLTWSSPRHLVKAGFAIPDWSRRSYDDRSNTDGTFSFASLDDYAAGRPYRFEQQRGDGRLSFTYRMVAAFVQDEIAVRPNLSVSLGLRYDWLSFYGDANNLAPRASFAYMPGSKGRTVIRGGSGLFYDRTGEGPIADILRSSQGRLFRYVLLDPGYPDPLTGGTSLASQPTSLVHLAPALTIPYTIHYSLGVERQLVKGTTLAVTYAGARGFDLFRSRDANAPPPPLYAARPDAAHGVIRQIESTGRQVSHSLQVTLRGKVTRVFSGSIQYVLSSIRNDTGGIGSFPANNYDLSGEWSRASADERHRLELMGTIKPVSWFTLGVAYSARSGRPYSLTTGLDAYNTGNANARPAGVARNSLQGPGSSRLDLRWSHEFALGKAEDGPKVAVGLDAFNVTNRVNSSGYVGNMRSPFFGRAISSQPARRLQLSLKFEF